MIQLPIVVGEILLEINHVSSLTKELRYATAQITKFVVFLLALNVESLRNLNPTCGSILCKELAIAVQIPVRASVYLFGVIARIFCVRFLFA